MYIATVKRPWFGIARPVDIPAGCMIRVRATGWIFGCCGIYAGRFGNSAGGSA